MKKKLTLKRLFSLSKRNLKGYHGCRDGIKSPSGVITPWDKDLRDTDWDYTLRCAFKETLLNIRLPEVSS